ncbi:MAG: hypothetical protein DF168_00170 [Candidatus Moanabacter tarae]|uniref:Vitamin B12 transporter BtuB n=1 Tax=Candidatus Moanibacter tarae TaxID=2200854 RepID=A0A2Z4ADK9_9BACT|nr:MAG: hypothetical protein DF168_00170 [Candidatus Moanabacter tarae]|tara:strand:- start:13060 stop:15468 length:2409 start_codon:yes stop_codon:yes gene_type:complete
MKLRIPLLKLFSTMNRNFNFDGKNRDVEKSKEIKSMLGALRIFTTAWRTEVKGIEMQLLPRESQWEKYWGVLSLTCAFLFSLNLSNAQSEPDLGKEVPELANFAAYYGSQESINRTSVSPLGELGTAPDLAGMMRWIPGATLVNNGPISGQAQYRGLFGPRVNILLEGVYVNPGGPNWMDPPLHYMPRNLTESLEVIQGVAPVSVGMEVIGGSVSGKYYSIPYSGEKRFQKHGRTELVRRSVDGGTSAALIAGISNNVHRIQFSSGYDEGDNYKFPGGVLRHSSYKRETHRGSYDWKKGEQQFSFALHHTATGDSGNPSLPMDIKFVNTDIYSARYEGQWSNFGVQAKIHYSEVDHWMSNYTLRSPPDFNVFDPPQLLVPLVMAFDGEDRRDVSAQSSGLGYAALVGFPMFTGTLSIGGSGHLSSYNVLINDPDSAFFVRNFNDVIRDRYGFTLEWKGAIGESTQLDFGVLWGRVVMAAGPVSLPPLLSTSAVYSMSAPVILQNRFNGADRTRSDNHYNFSLNLDHELNRSMAVSLGIGRKTRSASHIERYSWLPIEATAGLSDFNNYVGDFDLNPEIAHEVDLAFHLGIPDRTRFSVRFFFRDIEDFIQGSPFDPITIGPPFDKPVEIVSALNGDPTPMKFTNTNAEMYGFDLSGEWRIASAWTVSFLASCVRGNRTDIDDNLYRIAPPNASIAMKYGSEKIFLTVEGVGFGRGRHLSKKIVLNEVRSSNSNTSGYALLNLLGVWHLNEHISFVLGVENVFNRLYAEHLSGFNRVRISDVPVGERISGPGRNISVQVGFEW